MTPLSPSNSGKEMEVASVSTAVSAGVTTIQLIDMD